MSLPAAVTFDCWNTLLVERSREMAWALRVAALRGVAAAQGIELDEDRAEALLRAAHARHVEHWRRGASSGAREVAQWALEALELQHVQLAQQLSHRFEEAGLALDVAPLPGAATALESLRARGVRTALICDTGFSGGRIVRQLLARTGLLTLLEVVVFSDEVGVPKPDRRMFEAAMGPLGVAPVECVHVGDLKRTDVQGGRGAGMGTVRLLAVHDDPDEGPEADARAGSYAEALRAIEAARTHRR